MILILNYGLIEMLFVLKIKLIIQCKSNCNHKVSDKCVFHYVFYHSDKFKL